MRYNVVLLQPEGYVHALGLWDVCRLLHCSFTSLGMTASLGVNRLDASAINVVVGYHMATEVSVFGGCRVIFYQLEQLSETGGWFNPQRLEILKRGEQVWDYSPENVAFLRGKGLKNIKLLPLGFHEKLRTIPSVPEDYDVIFYGSRNARRRHVLERLDKLCRIQVLFGVYGQERDNFIARSKIALNMHYYGPQILEQARLSYLINNARFVVSESAAYNPYDGMIVTAPYEVLVETCMRFVNDEPARRRIAEEAFERFRERPMVEYLRAVLDRPA